MSDERSQIVDYIRGEALTFQNRANLMTDESARDTRRRLLRLAEDLGRLANAIERGEHIGWRER